LKVFRNEEAVPGYYNMILGLFNASGKYVMHCNDRDIVFVERIPAFINFLKMHNYSYIRTTRGFLEPSNNVVEYEAGYESLLHQEHSGHPTGMVYNTEILQEHLRKENYRKYVNDTFTYCFLMRDVMMYGKSAWIDNGCWNERHSSIKLQLKSGSIYKGGLYFETEQIIGFMESVIKHYMESDLFKLNHNQKMEISLNVIDYFQKHLIFKKKCYADNRECAHYGMKMSYIGIRKMKEIYQVYNSACKQTMIEYNADDETIRTLDRMQEEYMHNLRKDCLGADISIVKKYVKRLIDSTYPY